MVSKTYKFKMVDFKRFVSKMKKRLKMGDERYGNDWLTRNLHRDMEEELLDLACYAYLIFRKAKVKNGRRSRSRNRTT